MRKMLIPDITIDGMLKALRCDVVASLEKAERISIPGEVAIAREAMAQVTHTNAPVLSGKDETRLWVAAQASLITVMLCCLESGQTLPKTDVN